MPAHEPDLLGVYLKQIGDIPLLSAADEVELARRVEAGLYAGHLIARAPDGDRDAASLAELREIRDEGRRAKELLIRSNLRLVVSAARRYAQRGLPLLDVIQEGNLGLMRAVEKFDYKRGYKFSTYGMWWIRQAIERGIHDKSRTVRLPTHVGEELSRLARTGRRLAAELGREPRDAELAEAAGRTVAEVTGLRRLAQDTVSLDLPVGEHGESNLGDLIADEDGPQVHELTEQRAMSAELRALVTALPPREAFIIRQRYGLAGREVATYGTIADHMGLTRERVRQLERQALKRLRGGTPVVAWAS
ncbi:sigma-70 family RNA polymerase sigma factor [Nonomuraea roseoviolacea subsp. roseoviolacea]|uniref:sigma-70 family RNA polymerase sigma factor n=1 Tax=Nonomuraea roseoviolacea TaxID=103837 RepID=UPI0031DBF279